MDGNTSASLTVEQAAEQLGVNKISLYNAIKRGEVPFPVLRIGRRLVVPREAFERALRGEAS